jgi:hypothetical protein
MAATFGAANGAARISSASPAAAAQAQAAARSQAAAGAAAAPRAAPTTASLAAQAAAQAMAVAASQPRAQLAITPAASGTPSAGGTPAMTVTTTTLSPDGATQTTTLTTTLLTPGQAQAIITAANKNESDACMSLPSCNAYVQDCSVWSSQACTNVVKTCVAVLGPPLWPGANCTMGQTMPKWPYTYAMTPLQLAQYNCCVVNYKERTLGNFRAIQHTKGAPPVGTLDAATGVVTMAGSPPPSPPPRRAFGGV